MSWFRNSTRKDELESQLEFYQTELKSWTGIDNQYEEKAYMEILERIKSIQFELLETYEPKRS